jgi:hypothetical protein
VCTPILGDKLFTAHTVDGKKRKAKEEAETRTKIRKNRV